MTAPSGFSPEMALALQVFTGELPGSSQTIARVLGQLDALRPVKLPEKWQIWGKKTEVSWKCAPEFASEGVRIPGVSATELETLLAKAHVSPQVWRNPFG